MELLLYVFARIVVTAAIIMNVIIVAAGVSMAKDKNTALLLRIKAAGVGLSFQNTKNYSVFTI